MLKYALACVLMLALGLSADAQGQKKNPPSPPPAHPPSHPQHHHHHAHPPVHHHLRHTHKHYNYRYYHTPRVLVYGHISQYQQYGFAVVGYSDLVAIQAHCSYYGFQIVRVNPVQQFVVVRLPVHYSLNTITTFGSFRHVRFVEPAHRHYR